MRVIIFIILVICTNMSTIVFIDTTVYLNAYQYDNDIVLSLLNNINNNHDRIITTDIVEMEYKKNRQGVIIRALGDVKTNGSDKLKIPSFLKESQYRVTTNRISKDAQKLSNRVRERIEKVLESPSRYDPVYKILQNLFSSKKDIHLNGDKKEIIREIRELGRERFLLGFPPRKPKDTSYGDAINWEWIIYCAKHCSDDIVLISQDLDYGAEYKSKVVLNDFLADEFKKRVGSKRKIYYTRKLSEGLNLAGISVSKADEEAEDKMLKELTSLQTYVTIANINNNFLGAMTSGPMYSTIAFEPGVTVHPNIFGSVYNPAVNEIFTKPTFIVDTTGNIIKPTADKSHTNDQNEPDIEENNNKIDEDKDT